MMTSDTYITALALVAEIDQAIKRGVYHYRDSAGNLLHSLDQVVRAILDDDCPIRDEVNGAGPGGDPDEVTEQGRA